MRDTPAVDGGSTMTQCFFSHDTQVYHVYGIKNLMQFFNILSDNIHKFGAMETQITDGGKYEISKKVTNLLHTLFISQYESEPYHQHQNKSKNHYGAIQCYTNTIINLSGCPPSWWLLCMTYACHLLNVTVSPTLGGITPFQALAGQVPDISFLLFFIFWEPIYYKVEQSEPDLLKNSSSLSS